MGVQPTRDVFPHGLRTLTDLNSLQKVFPTWESSAPRCTAHKGCLSTRIKNPYGPKLPTEGVFHMGE